MTQVTYVQSINGLTVQRTDLWLLKLQGVGRDGVGVCD